MDRGFRRGGRERAPGRLPAGRTVHGLPDGRAQRGRPWKRVQQPCGYATVRLTLNVETRTQHLGRPPWKSVTPICRSRSRRRRTHLLIQLGGILASDGVLGYDEEVWGDEGNRRRLLGALGAHAGELRVWARDAGVTLPGPEPDALAGESGTSSYGI